jgi:hypothetical protein
MRAYQQPHVVVISVVVPTVERGLRTLFFWRMAIAGQMPSMRSTSGFFHPLEELTGVGDSDST